MIENYLNSKKVNGATEATLKNYTSLFRHFNRFKPIEAWTKKDVDGYILKLKDEKYSRATIEGRKTILKDFFKWAGKPEMVSHLDIKKVDTRLNKNDILDTSDVNKMIEATASPMYKSLIALLFESGARINEILKVRVKDCIETDKGMIVSVHQTKTGNDFRRILCVFSGQYIRNHITYSAKSKDDLLFDLTTVSVWEMLQKISKKAGIEKPVSCHKFRHAEATMMVQQGYNEAIIRKKLGWSPTSAMIARYQHLNDDDVINATAEKSGTGTIIPKKPIENIQQAEAIKIADASFQLSKLSEENSELKKRLDDMEQKRKTEIESLKAMVIALAKNELNK